MSWAVHSLRYCVLTPQLQACSSSDPPTRRERAFPFAVTAHTRNLAPQNRARVRGRVIYLFFYYREQLQILFRQTM